MVDQPIAISGINDPSQVRVKLLSSGREVHAPMSAVSAASIHAAPLKTTPVNADEFSYWDSVGLKTVKATWANLKATLFAAFTFTTSATGPKLIGGTGTGSSLALQSTSGVGATDFINFLVGNNGATEGGRFTSSGAFLAGSTLAPTQVASGSVTPAVQLHGTTSTGQTPALGIFQWSSGAANILVGRSRGGTVGTRGVVAANDPISAWVFYGDDGTNFIPAAEIRGLVDGAPGTNNMPGRIVFSTTTGGAAAVSERLRIDNNGFSSFTGSVGRGAPVTKSADFTLANTENNIIVTKGSTCTATFPSASLWTGREVLIKTTAAFTTVSASSNVVPLAGGAAGTAILATAGKWAKLISDGTNWVIMAGN